MCVMDMYGYIYVYIYDQSVDSRCFVRELINASQNAQITAKALHIPCGYPYWSALLHKIKKHNIKSGQI